jgi:hypothetical protein
MVILYYVERHVDQDFAKQRMEAMGITAIEEAVTALKMEVSQFKAPVVGSSATV